MSCSKKDYIAIAAMLKAAAETENHFYASNESGYTKGVKTAAHALAMYFCNTNPRFDRERFLAACGVQS